jgi:NDP-sugar pyrophosphorylase family protein
MIMKIVLEETLEHLKGKRRVEIEWDQDDMDIYEFKEQLLEPALLAWTYQPNTIAELFGEEEVEDNEIAKTEYDFDDGNGKVPAHKHYHGNGWVADTAEVDDSVYVGENATVCGNAKVCGKSKVYGDAVVYGDAKVYGSAVVCGDAKVYGNAKVYGRAVVYGDARVADNDIVTGETK